MAATEFRISIPIKGSVDETVRKIAARLGDKAGLLKNLGEAELQVVQARFDSKTAPDGSAWAPNHPLTLMLATGGAMMKRSGGLVNSINYTVAGDKLTMGPNKIYDAVHQFGATITGHLRIPVPAGTMMSPGGDAPARRTNAEGAIFLASVTIPARPYMGIGEKDIEAIAETIEDWLDLE